MSAPSYDDQSSTAPGRVRLFLRTRRGRIALIAAAVVVALGISASVLALTAGPASAALRTTEFTAATGAVANPERGFYDRVDILTDRDFSASTRDGITLLHSYVRLDAFRDGPIDQATLDELTAGLAAVRQQGLTIVLRFAYNNGPYPDSEPDASEKVIEQQLTQVAPLLAENQDVIAGVEAGFIGAWGEWHSSTNGLDTDPAAKQRILNAIVKAVPAARDVLLRYPADLRALAAGTGAAQRIGNHQDCFLSGDPDDNGTWSRDGSTPAADKKLVAKAGTTALVGGETCNADPPARTNCTTAMTELAQMHFSYLNRDYEPNSLAKLKSEGCYDDIANRLGYRIGVASAALPGALDAGATSVQYRISLENTGFAAPANARPVYLVLRGSGTAKGVVTKVKLAADVRKWRPGTSTLVGAATVPALKSGDYTVSLWIPDAAAALRANPAYSIRLASDGVWDAARGENRIGTLTVAKG